MGVRLVFYILIALILAGCAAQPTPQAMISENTPLPPGIPTDIPLTATPSFTPLPTLTAPPSDTASPEPSATDAPPTVTATHTPPMPTTTRRPTASPIATATLTPPPPTATNEPSGVALNLPAPTATKESPPAAIEYTVHLSGIGRQLRQVYELGQSLGRDPHRFSKVGDCQSSAPEFLQGFDGGAYNLGSYIALQATIDQFAGSFQRVGPSAVEAFHPDDLLNPAWAPGYCNPGESSLICEYRLNNSAVAIIMIQPRTGDFWQDPYHDGLVQVIQASLDAGVIPVLSTLYGWVDHDGVVAESNRIVRQVADETNVPLWDFHASVAHLPNAGGDEDSWHMALSPTSDFDFSDPANFQYAMVVRNFETLQVLDIIWRQVLD